MWHGRKCCRSVCPIHSVHPVCPGRYELQGNVEGQVWVLIAPGDGKDLVVLSSLKIKYAINPAWRPQSCGFSSVTHIMAPYPSKQLFRWSLTFDLLIKAIWYVYLDIYMHECSLLRSAYVSVFPTRADCFRRAVAHRPICFLDFLASDLSAPWASTSAVGQGDSQSVSTRSPVGSVTSGNPGSLWLESPWSC